MIPLLLQRMSNNRVVELSTEIEGLDIFTVLIIHSYKFYPKYTAPIEVPKDAVTMRMITYRDGKVTGRMVSIPVATLKSRAGIK